MRASLQDLPLARMARPHTRHGWRARRYRDVPQTSPSQGCCVDVTPPLRDALRAGGALASARREAPRLILI
jgi:hypothetical protein